MRSILREFREFAIRGNAVDMTVGIVIGAAFTSIANSLVRDIVMPPVGLLLGAAEFADLHILLKEGSVPGPYETLKAAQDAGAVTMNVGLFINAIISFVMVALVLFLVVKGINTVHRREESAPKLTRDQKLLTEIRDLLKERGDKQDPAP